MQSMETLATLAGMLEGELKGITPGADLFQNWRRIETDTRRLAEGDVFAAIRGERFDGHDFAGEAERRGAAALIVDHPVASALAQFVVRDVREAYGLAAKRWRSRFAVDLTAVVGSNGKTTTTQMLAAILRERWGEDRMLATEGNFNNEIGVPHMLFKLRFEHRAAVIEAGMNHPGEMARLADWIRPTTVLMTNAQREHQEFLRSVEAAAHENGLMFAALPETGRAVFPSDDPSASIWASLARARGVSAVTFALGREADVWGELLRDGTLRIHAGEGRVFDVKLAISGVHNARNAVGAAAAALVQGVDVDSIRRGLEGFRALPGRGARSVVAHGRLTLIDDSYNANPDSLAASLKMLAEEPGPRMLVMGDMGEIGEAAAARHREAGLLARDLGIERLWATGELSREAAAAFGEGGRWFPTRDELAAALLESPLEGTMVVKASHSMGFSKIVEALKKI